MVNTYGNDHVPFQIRPDIKRTFDAMRLKSSRSGNRMYMLTPEMGTSFNVYDGGVDRLIEQAADRMRRGDYTAKSILEKVNGMNFDKHFVEAYIFVCGADFYDLFVNHKGDKRKTKSEEREYREQPGAGSSWWENNNDFGSDDYYKNFFKNDADKKRQDNRDREERFRFRGARPGFTGNGAFDFDENEFINEFFKHMGGGRAYSNDRGQSQRNQGPKFDFNPFGGSADTGCYATLGIKPDSSSDVIKKAYRNKMKDCHPDTNSHRLKEATEESQRINAAYGILKKAGKVK